MWKLLEMYSQLLRMRRKTSLEHTSLSKTPFQPQSILPNEPATVIQSCLWANIKTISAINQYQYRIGDCHKPSRYSFSCCLNQANWSKNSPPCDSLLVSMQCRLYCPIVRTDLGPQTVTQDCLWKGDIRWMLFFVTPVLLAIYKSLFLWREELVFVHLCFH